MLCFLGVLDGVKCLQTESLTNLIKINSLIRCIRKTVKSDCYLQHVCLSAWNDSAPIWHVFMNFLGGILQRKFNFG
jgi:hypothetical protein